MIWPNNFSKRELHSIEVVTNLKLHFCVPAVWCRPFSWSTSQEMNECRVSKSFPSRGAKIILVLSGFMKQKVLKRRGWWEIVREDKVQSACGLLGEWAEWEKKKRESHPWKSSRQLSGVWLARTRALFALLTYYNAPLLFHNGTKGGKSDENPPCTLNPHRRTVALLQFVSQHSLPSHSVLSKSQWVAPLQKLLCCSSVTLSQTHCWFLLSFRLEPMFNSHSWETVD